MGAEISHLGQYTLEDPVDDGTWVVKQGVSDDDDTLITVFTDESKDKQKKQLFHRNIKHLKSIRHPCILHYLSSGEVSSGPFLVTERVSSLRNVIDTLEPIEVCAGLFDVLQGLSFLHEKAGVSHNNICMESVYVNSSGHWKIGGLEHACKYTDVTPDFLSSTKKYRNESSIPPEEKDGKLNTSLDYGHSRDVYSFAVLSEILLEHLQSLGDQTKTFELRIQDECLNPDPKLRPKLSTLLDDRFFRNNFLSISRFLQDITLKTDIERKIFFSDILQKLLDLPEDAIARRLSQPLLCRFVLLDVTARETLIPHILTPCRGSKRPKYVIPGEITPVFTVDIYKSYIIPEIYKIFHCHDYYIRVVLLTYFSSYVDLFEDKSTLEEIIFPQILLGVRDAHDDLAALSLRALADLVPILGRDVVIGGKSKVYFSTGTPKFDKKISSSKDENYKSNSTSGMGNILLKDLAKITHVYKHDTTETDDDKERKKREREERRKEAKRKRELRRIEKQKKSQEETSVHKIDPESDSISLEVSTGKDNVCMQNMENEPSKLSYGSQISRTISETQNGESENIVIDSSNQNEDWSDWDDVPDDSDERNNSIGGSKSHQDIHSNSVDFIGQHLTYDLNNQLTPSDNSSLQSHVYSVSDNDQSTKPLDYVKENVSWVSGKRNENKTEKKQGVMSLKGSKRITPKKKEALGSEFDIKSIEINVEKMAIPAEIDFFAEMAPEIKPGKLFSELDNVSEKKDKEETSKNNKNLTYQAADIDAGDSWGDDLEWGEDGF